MTPFQLKQRRKFYKAMNYVKRNGKRGRPRKQVEVAEVETRFDIDRWNENAAEINETLLRTV
jgi:hypothetical protein